MMNNLVLTNSDGHAVRTFPWKGNSVRVIRRGDSGRIELVSNLAEVHALGIAYEDLGEFSVDSAKKEKSFLVKGLGHLEILQDQEVVKDEGVTQNRNQITWLVLFALLFAVGGMLVKFRDGGQMSEKMEADLKQQIVKIAKKLPPRVTAPADHVVSKSIEQKIAKSQKQRPSESLKRMGALAALGNPNSKSQKSGLNLGAVQTSAGPGLGGTQGSGGTQTSLYAKGIVGAPLGAGGNIHGAGGYGTKGKGGGQEGYGTLSLVGSAGSGKLPWGEGAQASVGLERDQIAEVIKRNLGQVRFCYEQGLQSEPTLTGRVVADFVIAGSGSIRVADIGSTTLNSKIVEDCILMRLRTWKFPLPQGGVDVKVSYPFVLRRNGQG